METDIGNCLPICLTEFLHSPASELELLDCLPELPLESTFHVIDIGRQIIEDFVRKSSYEFTFSTDTRYCFHQPHYLLFIFINIFCIHRTLRKAAI